MPRRDDFDKATIDALAKRAAYICSNPDCRALTIAPSSIDEDKFIYIGKAAHITAASEGGPRYDPTLSPEARKSISNGIFLCSNCADMIDKNLGSDFSAQLLYKWKREHEIWVSENLNKRVIKNPEPNQTFLVTSHNQRGGITAGVVNIGSQPRKLDLRLQHQLKQLLTDKTKTVTITSVLGDGEAYSFANQIKEYLIDEGYSVRGINQVVFTTPVFGQSFNPNTLTFTIGTKQ
jgi:hypothetical protein